MQLAKPLGLGQNPTLSKVELPYANESYAGEEAVITGFGYTWVRVIRYLPGVEPIELGGKPDEKLKYAHADVLTKQECQRGYRSKVVRDSELCARLRQDKTGLNSGVCSVSNIRLLSVNLKKR